MLHRTTLSSCHSIHTKVVIPRPNTGHNITNESSKFLLKIHWWKKNALMVQMIWISIIKKTFPLHTRGLNLSLIFHKYKIRLLHFLLRWYLNKWLYVLHYLAHSFMTITHLNWTYYFYSPISGSLAQCLSHRKGSRQSLRPSPLCKYVLSFYNESLITSLGIIL